MLEGQEIQKLEDETGKYEGEVKDGKRNGQGTNIGLYGEKYVGNWEDDVPEGYGVYTERNGTRYEGQWKEGSPQGKGKATYSDGATYEGEFSGGVRHGKGTYVFPNGIKYVGEFVNNRAVNKGALYYTSGAVYEGGLNNYEPAGTGTSTFANGDKYVGSWRNGLPDGQGTYTLASGESADGEWKKGEFTFNHAGGGATKISVTMKQDNLVNYTRTVRRTEVAQTEAVQDYVDDPLMADGKNPPKKSGFSMGVSSRNIKEKLFEEAISRGFGYNAVDGYSIHNKYNIPVTVEELSAFLKDKGYDVGRYTTRRYQTPEGNIAMVNEMEFFPADRRDRYAYSLIREASDPDFKDFKGRGKFFYGEYGMLIHTCPNVLWSGAVVAGLLNGYGVGLVCEEEQYTVFDGEFVMGFPTDDIKATRWKRSEVTSSKASYQKLEYRLIAESSATAKDDYKAALREYADATYDERANVMEDKYDRALVLNNNWPGAIPQTKEIRDMIRDDKQLFQQFVQLYGSAGVDPRNLIPKVKEMIDLYVVLESVTKEFNVRDYIKLGFFRYDWDPDSVKKQRDIMEAARANSAERSKDQMLSFRRFYASAREFLPKKQKELEEHINKSREMILAQMESERIELEEYRIEQAVLDSKKSFSPYGDKVYDFWRSHYSYEHDGKAFLNNGDYVEYNVWCNSDGSVDHFIMKHSYPVIDSYVTSYNSLSEMVQALVTASKNKNR